MTCTTVSGMLNIGQCEAEHLTIFTWSPPDLAIAICLCTGIALSFSHTRYVAGISLYAVEVMEVLNDANDCVLSLLSSIVASLKGRSL